MPGIRYGTSTGELVIGTVNLHCPAWCALNLTELWVPGDIRGSDRLVPGANGVRAYRRRPTVTERSIPMVVTGYVNETGAENVDPWEGLETNLGILTDLVHGSADPRGVHDATLTMPSGEVRTAEVHVLGLLIGDLGVAATLASLELSIPSGSFS